MDIEKSDLLTAKGIASDVGESGGHILLLDYDENFRDLRDKAKALPGVTLVFESSPGSWHAWNLTVRTLDQTALAHLRAKADPHHAGIGLRRGRWTLRVGPKTRANAADADDPYKRGVEYKNGWVNRTELPQSMRHFRMGLSLMPEKEADKLRSRALDYCPEWVTEPARIEEYLTITDPAKEAVANAK